MSIETVRRLNAFGSGAFKSEQQKCMLEAAETIGRLTEAMEQIVTVINDNHRTRRKTMILQFVKQVADNAISGTFVPPITCRDVASCQRHGECMYLGCPARGLMASPVSRPQSGGEA